MKNLINKLLNRTTKQKAWHGSYLINHFLKN